MPTSHFHYRYQYTVILANSVDIGTALFVELKQEKYRRYFMSAHVVLILFNELGNRDKMRDLQSIWSLFRNKFNKFQEC